MRHLKAFIIALVIFTVFILSVLTITSKIIIPHKLNIGASTEVPELVGLKLSKAKKLIEESGFHINDKTSIVWKYSPLYEKGTILEQKPLGKKKVKEGCEMELIVSLGSEKVVIPLVVEENYVNASSTLKQIGLEPVIIRKNYGTLALNKVSKIEPKSGTEVLKGSKVTLYVESDMDNEYLIETNTDSLTTIDSLSINDLSTKDR